MPLNKHQVFSITYLNRLQIARMINDFSTGGQSSDDDDRLTDEICQQFVNDHYDALMVDPEDNPGASVEVVCMNYARMLFPLSDDPDDGPDDGREHS